MNKTHIKFVFKTVLLLSFILLPSLLHAHDNIAVHPYIAEQAFEVWPKDRNHEIFAYLGNGLRYAKCGPYLVDPLCYNEMCSISGTGSLITEGTIEEDMYDAKAGTCAADYEGIGFVHHFYNPDAPDPNGLYGQDGALVQAQFY